MNSEYNKNGFIENCSNRANIYKIFADCFRYPDAQLKKLLDPFQKAIAFYDKTMEDDAAKLIAQLKPDDAMNSLQVEYSRLFIGPFSLETPPYGSVYMDKQGLVMGEFTQEAIKFYLQAGLDPSDENKEPPDHISTELEFMYYLLFQQVMKQNAEYFDLANSFLQKHLGLWVHPFTQKIAENTQNKFYLELANLLDNFIRIEKGQLNGNQQIN